MRTALDVELAQLLLDFHGRGGAARSNSNIDDVEPKGWYTLRGAVLLFTMKMLFVPRTGEGHVKSTSISGGPTDRAMRRRRRRRHLKGHSKMRGNKREAAIVSDEKTKNDGYSRKRFRSGYKHIGCKTMVDVMRLEGAEWDRNIDWQSCMKNNWTEDDLREKFMKWHPNFHRRYVWLFNGWFRLNGENNIVED